MSCDKYIQELLEANTLSTDQILFAKFKLFDTLIVFLKVFFLKKVNFEKKSADNQKAYKISQHTKS